MNRPCRLGECRHCQPGRPCGDMRRWLAEERDLDWTDTPDRNTANTIIPPDQGRWAWPPRMFARNIDDPINDKD